MMSYSKLENTYISMLAHTQEMCSHEVCSLHKRTEHHMRSFRQIFRYNINVMSRVCTHGAWHPDPDDPTLLSGEYNGEHECDACCIRSATEEEFNGNNN